MGSGPLTLPHFLIFKHMIKTRNNRGFERRYIDISAFVDGRVTTVSKLNNKFTNYISLYDYVLSHLSRQSMCDNWSGTLLADFDIFMPSAMFLTGSNKNRTGNRNIDLWSVANTIISEESLCDLPFAISAQNYTVDYLKNLFISYKFDTNEVSKAFAVVPQKVRRSTPNDSVSLKTVINNYAVSILGIDSLPTVAVTVTSSDPDAVTVVTTGLEADGVTNLATSGKFYMWVNFNGTLTALNSGNLIDWGDSIIAGDVTYFTSIGVESITDVGGLGSGTYDSFQFVKNATPNPALAEPIEFIVRAYEDYSLATEKFTYRVEDTCPVLASGTR